MKILLNSDEKRGEAFPKLGLGYLISYINKHYPEVEFEVTFHKEDILGKIREFKPDRVVLFGSWAWGKPHRDSDVDLCVIKETRDTRALARKIDGVLRKK